MMTAMALMFVRLGADNRLAHHLVQHEGFDNLIELGIMFDDDIVNLIKNV